MMTKTYDIFLKLPNRSKSLGKGVYGLYFKISQKRGVKLIGRGWKSLNRLLKSSNWQKAIKETLILNFLEDSGLTPKNPKLAVVQYKNKFYPGVEMEHISGKTLDSHNSNISFDDVYIDNDKKFYTKKNKTQKSKKAIRVVEKIFKKYKIKHRDLHDNNVMVTYNKKIKIIDFSPDQIKMGFKI